MSKPLFKEVGYTLSKLMDDIEMGNIGLPDIQRPFVWANKKVRDLFDSMYRGYPVGYLLFWENQVDNNTKHIGTISHQRVPNLLIVDGQQRLTSLFAVVKDISVIRENYEEEKIEISFKPLDGSFEVADASIRRSPEWISNISMAFKDDVSQFQIINDYKEKLRKARDESNKELSKEEERECERSLQKLFGILSFPFTVLELSSDIDEEQVAEVFVRINSKGKTLNQSDFILTLMSVFWEEGRNNLESFCRYAKRPIPGKEGPYNYFIEPEPDQLLRASIGFGFRRARLKYAYSLLRGKDLETGEVSEQQREKQFETLRKAQERVLNLQNWHDFLLAIQQSGYRSSKMISSETTLIYSYVFYLIGKEHYKLDHDKLRKLIGKWFFMTMLTNRYISSSETTMGRDLADLRKIQDSEEFVSWMNQLIDSELTEDFWKTTLPARMETSSSNTPTLHCYIAALNILDAKVLFSNIKIWDALDPTTKAYRNKVERHHLFPKAYLKSFGISSTRDTNQIANFAYVEWRENTKISDLPPSEYFPKVMETISEKEKEKLNFWHALPKSWYNMTYNEFLLARRKLMAQVTKEGFKKLSTGFVTMERPRTIEELINAGEGPYTEFKSTLRKNLYSGSNDTKMEHAVLKTISGFLNSDGGTLVIGVADNGDSIGLEEDGFPNEDKMDLHLGNLIKSRLGTENTMHIKPKFIDYKDKRALLVDCKPSQKPVYLKNGNEEEFYIRAGASSAKLTPSQMNEYIKQRFL